MDTRHFKLLIIITLLLIPLGIARPTYTNGEEVTLSVPCTIGGTICGITATCDGTVINPLDEVLYNQYSMIQNGAVFEMNLTTTDTETNGEYRFSVSCSQGGRSSSKTLIFSITPNGEQATTGKGILYGGMLFVLVILFVLALYGGTKVEGIVGRSAFWGIAYLLLIGITFLSWNLSIDYMTSAPFMGAFFRIIFLVLLWSALPIILVLTFYTMWMMKNIDAIQNMINKGMPIDEAYERQVRQGHSNRRNW